MKIKGKEIRGPQVRVIVLPRQGGDLIFKFKAVLETPEFDKLCPVPEPPEALLPGGGKKIVYDDKKYLEKLGEWSEKKTHYTFLLSIAATDDLEWESVDMGDPTTWANYQKELSEAGLTEAERVKLLGVYSETQGLNQDKIDEATKRFLAGHQVDTEE